MHVPPPSTEYCPVEHVPWMELESQKLPAGQGVQYSVDNAPAPPVRSGAYVPAAHAIMVLAVEDKHALPAGHAVHDVVLPVEKKPAVHTVGAAVVDEQDMPAGQSMHRTESASEYWPAMQVMMRLVSVRGHAVPATHDVQAVAPSRDQRPAGQGAPADDADGHA